jgi:hypothetical protein
LPEDDPPTITITEDIANRYKTNIKSPPTPVSKIKLAKGMAAPRIEAAAAIIGTAVKIPEEAVTGTILSLLNNLIKS